MYKLKLYTTGKFEIYNVRRKKLVFAGLDKSLKETLVLKHEKSEYEFKDVKELMQAMNTWVSLGTFKKISKVLCSW